MAATQAVAVAWLARAGFRPRGDLVLVAQADEEDGSRRAGLAWLRAQRPDLRCDYSLDEGGGRRLELADGRVVVTLNVGEKATLPVLVTARGEAGHASVPTEANAVLRLATLLERLGSYRPERRLLPETRRLLELLAGPVGGDLDGALERAARLHPALGDNLAARFATTIAPTRLRGSSARNVIPARASVECDCRVLPGTTPAALEAELRRALGDGVRMMVDANQKLDVLGNIRQAALLEEFDLVWYEEPVLADDLAACAEVAHAIRIPIATGENNYTRYEFREIIERKAARYLMPDVCRANGFSETLRIARLAAAHSVLVSPHVVHELSLQVVAALSNGFLVEWIDWAPADLFEGMPRCEDGHFRMTDRPGHGLELGADAERKYRV
jgi:acetylornithine deacetylase/succinyl-diaminopimelate desuccinylase-like protein